ncbi:hypothetical protein [Phaffia rhodozyma]|uniref:Uncharacterized protein n=1 Tax=Phaffia rhodozyma TaxID=264483 RepID=A0A0F7SMW5_PHARH|nr:hypothetical protein [Phaffia rhodozyma]
MSHQQLLHYVSSDPSSTVSTAWSSVLRNETTLGRLQPIMTGFASSLLEWICFTFRILACLVSGPLAFLILLDLVAYLLTRTLRIPTRRVRVPVQSPKTTTTASLPEGATTSALDLEKPLTFTTSSSTLPLTPASSPVSVFKEDSELAGGLGLTGVGEPVLGKVLEKIDKSSRRTKLSSQFVFSPVVPLPSLSTNYTVLPSPSNSGATTPAYMTTPGERHALLPSSDLTSSSQERTPPSTPGEEDIPSFQGVGLGFVHSRQQDGKQTKPRTASGRGRAASVGVEGALGLGDEDEDDEGETDGGSEDDGGGAMLRRRRTIHN